MRVTGLTRLCGIFGVAQEAIELGATTVRSAIEPAIRSAFIEGDGEYELRVWDGPSGGVRVVLVSNAFEGLDLDQRQDMAWGALRRVDDAAILEITSLLTVTREEADKYVWLPEEVTAS